MFSKSKYVTWRSLKKDQKIHGYKRGNSRSFFKAVVKSTNAAFVTVLKWGTEEEKIPAEETMFEVDMTEEEFKSQHAKGAAEVIKALQNLLAEYEIGYHEMWNAWIRYDPYEMAASCQHHKFKVVGVCNDITPKHNMFDHDLILDIGICAEYSDGERFWCHASRKCLDDMLAEYEGSEI